MSQDPIVSRPTPRQEMTESKTETTAIPMLPDKQSNLEHANHGHSLNWPDPHSYKTTHRRLMKTHLPSLIHLCRQRYLPSSRISPVLLYVSLARTVLFNSPFPCFYYRPACIRFSGWLFLPTENTILQSVLNSYLTQWSWCIPESFLWVKMQTRPTHLKSCFQTKIVLSTTRLPDGKRGIYV